MMMPSDDDDDSLDSDIWNGSSYFSDGLRLEACQFGKDEIMLPEEFIEKHEIFSEVMSMETWKDVLTEEQRKDLSALLPSFPDDDDNAEEEETIRRLFSGDNFKFGNPLSQFYSLLKEGYLSPSVAKYAELCRKAKYKEYKYSQQRYYHKLLKDVLISRQKLLGLAAHSGPDTPLIIKKPAEKPYNSTVEYKTSLQYYRVLQECRQECGETDTSSEDEAFPGTPLGDRKKKRLKNSGNTSDIPNTPTSPRIVSTLMPKPANTGPLGNNQTAQSVHTSHSGSEIAEDDFNKMINLHRKRRARNDDHPELDTTNIILQDVILRTNPHRKLSAAAAGLLPPAKKKHREKDKLEKKKWKRLKSNSGTSHSSTDFMPDTTPMETSESIPPTSVSMVTDNAIITSTPTGPLPIRHPCGMYSNFLSLLRDTITAAPDFKITLQELQEKVTDWQKSSTSLLNNWFNLHQKWSELVPTALKWLAAGKTSPSTNFSPKLEFGNDKKWKWIGMGNDSDGELILLWKQFIPLLREKKKKKKEKTSTPEKKEITDIPSPRMRTDYVVKPSLDEQKKIIREQETRRYEQPHKAFTFCFNGYESVVGPVKGVFGKETTMNKAREHFLLVSDRPPYVTILSVVRDSVARLPNGEGTRADICELLKDSQFIAESATDSQINTVVSGALDRLHYEKDPCVKYDTHRKLWIYLHRSRMEGEFERIHQEQAEAEKAKKAMQKPKLSAKVKTPVKDMTGKSPPLARPSSSLSETSNDSLVSSNLSFEPQSPNKSPADATSTSPKGFAKVLMGGKSVITSTNPRIHPPASVLSPRVSTPSTPGALPGGMAKGMPTLLTFGVKDVTQTQSMVAASGKSPKGGIAGSFPVAISGVTVHSTTASAIPGTVVLKNTSRAATIPGQVATLTTSATTSVASSNVNPILVPGSVIQQSHPNVSVPAAVTVTTIQHAMAPTGKILSHIGGKPLKGHATQAGLRPTVVQSLGGKPFYVQAAGVGKQSRPTLHPLRMPALGKIQPGALGPLGIRLTAQGFEAIPTQHAQGATISPGLMTVSGDSGLRISQTQPMLGGKPVSLVLGTQSSSIPVSTITSQTARQSIAPTSFSATQSTTAVTTASIAFTSTQQTVLPATAGLKFALAQASQANKGLPKGAELKASTEQQKPVGISVITTAGTTDPKKSPGVGMPMSVLLSGSPHSRQSAITKSAVPVIASSMFAGMPSGLAGKGIFLAQVPHGSKIITGGPASTTLSGQKPPLFVSTTAIVTPTVAQSLSTQSTVVMTTALPTTTTGSSSTASTISTCEVTPK